MPDITMCASETCTHRKTCYRNPESGTKPGQRQSWFYERLHEGDECNAYWSTNEPR